MKGDDGPVKERAAGIDQQTTTRGTGAPPKPLISGMKQEADPTEDDEPRQKAPQEKENHEKPEEGVTDGPVWMPMVAFVQKWRSMRMMLPTRTDEPGWATLGIAKPVKYA